MWETICLWIYLFCSRDFPEFSIKDRSSPHLQIFTRLLFNAVFFHKLSSKFVQRDVLIHRLTEQGALGLRAHVAFKYKTQPPGRTLPKPTKRTEIITLLELEKRHFQRFQCLDSSCGPFICLKGPPKSCYLNSFFTFYTTEFKHMC